MRIDTKELRDTPNHFDFNDAMQSLEKCASELDRLYAIEDATTPFASRAEVETYLKGKGFVENKESAIGQQVEWTIPSEVEDEPIATFMFWYGGGFFLDIRGKNEPYITLKSYTHLTPALLDAILEAK